MKYVKYLSLFFFFFFPLFSLPCSDSHLPHEPHTHLSFLTHPNPLGLSPPALRTAPTTLRRPLTATLHPSLPRSLHPGPWWWSLTPPQHLPPAVRGKGRSRAQRNDIFAWACKDRGWSQAKQVFSPPSFTCRLREREYEASRVDLYLRDLFGWAYPKTTLSMLFWNRYQTGP